MTTALTPPPLPPTAGPGGPVGQAPAGPGTPAGARGPGGPRTSARVIAIVAHEPTLHFVSATADIRGDYRYSTVGCLAAGL